MRRRIIVGVGLGFLALSFLIVPWKATKESIGYSLIFLPPKGEWTTQPRTTGMSHKLTQADWKDWKPEFIYYRDVSVDVTTLGITAMLIVCVTGALAVLAGRPREPDPSGSA